MVRGRRARRPSCWSARTGSARRPWRSTSRPGCCARPRLDERPCRACRACRLVERGEPSGPPSARAGRARPAGGHRWARGEVPGRQGPHRRAAADAGRGRRPRGDHRERRPDERGRPVGPAQDARGAAGRRDDPPVRGRRRRASCRRSDRAASASASGWSGRATSRRSWPTTVWRIRRPRRGSAGSPVAARVSRSPTPGRPDAVLIRAELTRRPARPDRCPARRPAWPRPEPRSRAPSPWRRPSVRVDPAAAAPRPTRRRGPAAAQAIPPPAATVAPAADRERRRRRRRPRGRRRRPGQDPAVERRRGVEVLLGLWADVARDLVLVGTGGARSVHDTVLLDELGAISSRSISPGSAAAFLAKAARSADWLAGNVSPELVLDALVLAWPSRVAAA